MNSVENINTSRRKFVKIGSYTVAFGSLFGVGAFLTPHLHAKNHFLRPPGALAEKDFLATCIKCGQCVQVCPFHSLSLLDIQAGSSIGTPYIDASKRGCYLCDLFPCVLACPSGSLDHSVSEPKDIKMGVAKVNADACFAYKQSVVKAQDLEEILSHSNKNDREDGVLRSVEGFVGQECEICVSLCPYPDGAIKMGDNKTPDVLESCVGCGVCAELCPAKCIEIIPASAM